MRFLARGVIGLVVIAALSAAQSRAQSTTDAAQDSAPPSHLTVGDHVATKTAAPTPQQSPAAQIVPGAASAQGQRVYRARAESAGLQYAAVSGREVKNSSCKQDNWPNTTDFGFYTFDILSRIPAIYQAENGTWLPDSSEFRRVPSMANRSSEGSLLTYLLIAEQTTSRYRWSVSSDGILTISESGSDDNPANTPRAKDKLQSMELSWSGDATLDLKTGKYTWKFEAQIKGVYVAYPLYGMPACPVSASLVGSYDTILRVTTSGPQSLQTPAKHPQTITPCAVASLVASSNRGSQSPQTFPGAQSIPFNPSVTTPPGPGTHLAVFFNDVARFATASGIPTIDDFSVVITANLTCSRELQGSWKLVSGTADLVASQDVPNTATLRHLRTGGLYKVIFDLNDGSVPSEANIVLPFAGGEVKELMIRDLALADAFAKALEEYPTAAKGVILTAMGFGLFGNYLGRPDNASSPTVWRYNQVADDGPLGNKKGMGAIATWYGIPVRIAKLSNFIGGYAVEKAHIPAWMQDLANKYVGTKNDQAGDDSFRAGIDLADGRIQLSDLPNILIAIRNETRDNSNNVTIKLWPNQNVIDNFSEPVSFHDVNRQFTHPDFLSLSSIEVYR